MEASFLDNRRRKKTRDASYTKTLLDQLKITLSDIVWYESLNIFFVLFRGLSERRKKNPDPTIMGKPSRVFFTTPINLTPSCRHNAGTEQHGV